MPYRLSIFTTLLICSCTTSHKLAEQEPAPTTKKVENSSPPVIAAITPTVETKSNELDAEPPVKADQKVVAETIMKQQSPTLATTAKDLRLNIQQLQTQTRNLDRILRRERRADLECTGKARILNQSMCSFISSLNRSPSSFDRSRYLPYVPISPKYFSFQQRLPYEQLRKSIHKRSANEVLKWVSSLKKTTSCPRNLSIAAVRKLEELLPSPEAIRGMETLYKHASSCVRVTETHYEFFHFRQALLRQLWGMPKESLRSIRLAAKAVQFFERDRVLFWAGYLSKLPEEKSKYWTELVSDHPLSYHALEAWKHMKQDPYLYYTSKPQLHANRKVKGKHNVRAQQGIYWLEALYLTGRTQGASILAAKIMKRFSDSYTPNNIFYVASLKEEKNHTLAMIGFLSNQIQQAPAILNEQTLKMLFPKPYFNYFAEAQNKQKTDPYLLLALTRQESAFNPRARSVADARGLMQILPSTARLLSGRRWNDLYSPKTNVALGAKFVSQLISKFGSAEKALAAYNAGPGRVHIWDRRYPTKNVSLYMDLIPFKETRNYVAKIVRNNYWYERIYDGKGRELASNDELFRSDLVSSLVETHKSYASTSESLVR